MKKKNTYRVRNWHQYNSSLKQRGSLTIWFEEEALNNWINKEKSGKRGRSKTFSDLAIKCISIIKAVYHLPLRQTEGFVNSIISLMKLDLLMPDYSTISRRRNKLEIVLPRQSPDKPIHVVVDSSGVKVYGEGEWKVRQHGYTKRRTWVKLHIGVDENSKEIVGAVTTGNKITDKEALPDLLSIIEGPIKQVSADKGYDYLSCYQEIDKIKARAVIPPKRNARLHPFDDRWTQRNNNIKRIIQINPVNWKKESGYHRRSLAENGFFRLKKIFGDKINEKNFNTQACEMFIRCLALNKMTSLGMPQSYVA